MKVTKIFGIVLMFHFLAVALILLQPGCQTRKTPPPPPSPAPQSVAPPSQSPPTSSWQVRQEPMRPVGSPTPSTPQKTGSGTLDSAFNAGLGSGEDVLVPVVDDQENLYGSTEQEVEMATYRVKPGDNLTRIAREHGVTVADIKAANGLSGDMIGVGDDLLIPTSSSPAALVPVEIDAAGSKTYVVRSGDSLGRIAREHGTTVRELKAVNGLTSDLIRVGDELYLPGGSAAPVPAPAPSTPPKTTYSAPAPLTGGSAYQVKPGDSPIKIAKSLGVDVKELMRVNNISDPTKLKVGQTLIVPGGTAGSTSLSPVPPKRSSPAPASQPSSISITPKPSQPAVIDSSGQDELSLLQQLESDDLPLMEVQEDESDTSSGDSSGN